MINVDFTGAKRLITALDDAVSRPTPHEVAHGVKDSLSLLCKNNAIDLPPRVLEPGPQSYGRHLLYRSAEHGYVVVAMAWGPGQGTPVHDHDDVWCVEGVWRGQLEVVRYGVEERDGDRFRFLQHPGVMAGQGSAGALIPPFQYHALTNALRRETTITLHVYGRDLLNCSVFEPDHDGWFKRQIKSLSYTH